MESKKRKLEEDLKKVELKLENEQILKRKKKQKEKVETSKVSEITTKLTKNIDALQKRIRKLENENSIIKERESLFTDKRNSLLRKSSRNNLITSNGKSGLCHSQSNDALWRLKNKKSPKKDSCRDLSLNSKKEWKCSSFKSE